MDIDFLDDLVVRPRRRATWLRGFGAAKSRSGLYRNGSPLRIAVVVALANTGAAILIDFPNPPGA